MKQIVMAILLISAVLLSSAFAADTKVGGRLYAGWNLETSDGARSANDFSLSRAYLTVKSKLSDNASVRITTDLKETSAFDGYSVIMKYGYIDWRPDFGAKRIKGRFGLQPTLYIDNMNKIWGRRYLEKTVGDKNKFLTSSDLGFSAFVNLGEKGKLGYISLQVLNGTSYTNVEELNKNKDFGTYVFLKPFSDNDKLKRSRFQAQAYMGTLNKTIDTTDIGTAAEASAYKNQILSFGGMLGYKNSLDVGADLNFRTTGSGYDSTGTETPDLNSSGISFFGTFYFNGSSDEGSFGHSLNIFGRYDILDPNGDMSNDGSSLLIVGIERNPTKGFKTSLNFRSISYESNSKGSESYLYLNTLLKF